MSDSEMVNILIVDDLPEKLLVLRSILEELGENLIEASSGEKALARVLGSEFAVILLDVNMPGLDGYETAQLIRAAARNPPTRRSFSSQRLPMNCTPFKATLSERSTTSCRPSCRRCCALK